MGFTKKAAGLTAFCAAAVPFDPTGLALLGSAVGGTATCVSGTAKVAKNTLESSKERTAVRVQQSNLTQAEAEEYKDCIWKMTAGSIGVAVSGAMALVLPPAMVGLLISAPLLYIKGKKLGELKQKAGGHRALLKSISKVDLAAQVTGAAATKSVLLVLLLGNDVDVAAKGIHELMDDPSAIIKGFSIPDDNETIGHTRELIEAHQEMTDGGLLEVTTGLADKLPDLAKETMGIEGTPVWHDGTEYSKLVVLGVAQAVPELVGKAVMEDPAQKQFNKR